MCCTHLKTWAPPHLVGLCALAAGPRYLGTEEGSHGEDTVRASNPVLAPNSEVRFADEFQMLVATEVCVGPSMDATSAMASAAARMGLDGVYRRAGYSKREGHEGRSACKQWLNVDRCLATHSGCSEQGLGQC